jgi:hypothetical protein
MVRVLTTEGTGRGGGSGQCAYDRALAKREIEKLQTRDTIEQLLFEHENTPN